MCNGSTAAFGAVCPGSNPGSPASRLELDLEELLDESEYLIGEMEWQAILAAKTLVKKLIRWNKTTLHQIQRLGHLLAFLDDLPKSGEEPDFSLVLWFPILNFDETAVLQPHSVEKHISIRTTPAKQNYIAEVEINLGGVLQQERIGGDSFTVFRLWLAPGRDSDYESNLSANWMVQGLELFEIEVDSITLDDPGYRLMIEDGDFQEYSDE